MTTYLISHQKPDLDAVVSTIAYAEYLSTPASKNLQFGKIISCRCDPINNETAFVLSKFQVSPPILVKSDQIKPEDKIVLLDHNEENQRMRGLKEDQIIAIIDHHMPKISLAQPITVDLRPWGSTSTIIYDYFEKASIVPTTKTTKLILCAILSDTLGLASTTTITQDRKTVQKISQKLGFSQKDIQNLIFEIFKAKSNIANLTPLQIVANDYKIFNFAKKTFIGQLETVEPEKVLKLKPKLLEAMEKIKQKEKVNLVFFAVTDTIKENTQLIYLSEEEKKVAQKAFGGEGEANVLDIGRRLSRKKEIAPQIEKALK
jgi:manganese-dependent inorganic pyrophosphatase